MIKYTKDDISYILYNYQLIYNEASRLRKELNVSETVGVAVITDQPRSGGVTNRVPAEVMRRERKFKRLAEYERKISLVEDAGINLTGERNNIVLDHILNGVPVTKIHELINMSRSTVHLAFGEIVEQIKQIKQIKQITH